MNPFNRKTVSVNIEDTAPGFPVAREKRVRWWRSIPLKPGAVKDGLIVNFKALSNTISALISLKQMKKQILSASAILTRQAQRFWRWISDVFTKEIVTVNVEDSDLRFLVAKGKCVRQWGSIPLEPGTVKDGLVLNYQVLSNAIDELISLKQLKRRKIITSLSGFQSVHRTIELPKMPKRLLSKAILSEAKQAMPVSLEQLYLSWQKIGEEKGVQRFFLLGTPRNLLDTEVKCLNQSRLKTRAMNLKPIALARMADHAEALIIDIEPESCEIIMVMGGIPTIMRSIPMHSEYGLSDRAQHILQEFERTLRFHESNYPDLALSKDTPLFLTGKLAGEDDLSKTILAGTGFNAKPLASSLQCPPDLPLAKYAVNIGLALKASSAKHSARKDRFLITDIDILPEVYLPSKLSTKQALSVFGIIIGIALIIPLYRIGDSAAVEVRQLRNENSMLQQSFSLRQGQIKETGQIQQAIASVESTKQKLMGILQDLQQIGDQRQRAYDSLCLSVSHPPEGILPDGAKLSSISQESGKLNLLGQAPNYDTALEYADALRHTEGFSNVQVHSLTSAASKGEIVNFNISLDWK